MPDVTVRDIINNMYAVLDEIPRVVDNAILKHEAEIVAMSNQQLLEGKDERGNDLRPLYTEDPYFKSQKQARAYIEYKKRISPPANRNPNAPNLYINGYYHRSRGIVQEGEDMYVKSERRDSLSNDIERKYKGITGLYAQNQEKIENEIIAPLIWELLERV
jgi:hypothetical protein